MLSASVLSLLLSGVLALPTDVFSQSPEYDFVVVGGGSSGLVVANRLSENPSVSVAIIEAGDSVYNNTNVTSVTGYGLAFGTDIDYAYQSINQTYAGGKTQTLRAAKALGGTSTINGMVYLRAETAQINAWERLGNQGWNWESLLPFYKKSEGLQAPTSEQTAAGASIDPEYHGTDGPLSVGWPFSIMGGEIATDVNSTYRSLGLPWNADPNGGSMRGFNVYPKTVDRALNVRADAARAYYYPIANRTNLHLYKNSVVERMIWNDTTSSNKPSVAGVEYTTCSGERKTIKANKEVILSAGSLRSPLLLEHSGIGNPAILEKFGIDVVVSNKFVGENLQDQTTGAAAFNANLSAIDTTGSAGNVGYFSASDIFGNSTDALSATVSKQLRAYAEKVVNATGGVIDVDTTEKFFQIHHDLIFKNNLPVSEILIIPSESSVSVSYWGLLPFSRGNIHITSANNSAAAAINPNFFLLDYDVQQQIGTAKMSRAIGAADPIAKYITSESEPGLATVSADGSDEEWEAWVKSSYRSNFHYISTAAMMSEELGGVVDTDLLVYGTRNVRVVDASVVPMQVCGHLVSTLYAIAEKAADSIKNAHGL